MIADLSDTRAGTGSDNIVMAKTISAVRNVSMHGVICQNPPVTVQDLNSVLRACALEADRAAINTGTDLENSNSNEIGCKPEIKREMRKEFGFCVD